MIDECPPPRTGTRRMGSEGIANALSRLGDYRCWLNENRQTPTQPMTTPESSPNVADRGPSWLLVVFCMLTASLSPLSAMGQTTEPLLPVPAPPSGPQAPTATGQPTYPSETVTQRPRPELDPLGLHLGDFFWFPRAELDEAYNSNIFATPSRTVGDLITV